MAELVVAQQLRLCRVCNQNNTIMIDGSRNVILVVFINEFIISK